MKNRFVRSKLALQLLAAASVACFSCAKAQIQTPLTPTVIAPYNAAPTVAQLNAWGLETVAQIDKMFWMPNRKLYADKAELGKAPNEPSFAWGVGVQLSSLISAARVDPKRLPRLLEYADAFEIYWHEAKGIGGYDVWPTPKPVDRYYDDNQWIVMNQVELFELTNDKKWLDRAERTWKFVMSGADEKLGGGIYWREEEKTSKNTCSNGPGVVAALRLYEKTRKPEYFVIAQGLYNWTNEKLQDTDGLFWDNMKLNGDIDRTKFSYNSALMIRANTMFYTLTKEPKYLREAQRIGAAARTRWAERPNGALDDGGRFGHLFLESMYALYEVDRDPKWLQTGLDATRFLHSTVRDANGHYPDSWRVAPKAPLTKFELIDNASVARAYFETARVAQLPKTKPATP